MSTEIKRKSKTPQKEVFEIDEAVKLVKTFATARFDESVDLAIKLGVDPRKPNQMIRGAASLPNGLGKTIRVAVFAKGAKANEAEAAGADVVGSDDLAEKIKEGQLNFDRVIATPDCMGIVGKVARILGPRGLMPNPKMGTITMDVADGIKNAKQGQVTFKTDKFGVVNMPVGKVSFPNTALKENISQLIKDIESLKPKEFTGNYFKKVTISSTMGKGFSVDLKGEPFSQGKRNS